MNKNLHKELGKILINVDTELSNEVQKVANWLRPKKLKDGLGPGDALAQLLLEKADIITPDEVRLLARFVSGQLACDLRKKKDYRTTNQKIDIYIAVKQKQLELEKTSKTNLFDLAVNKIADEEGLGFKATENYCTQVSKMFENLSKENYKNFDERMRKAYDLHTLSKIKNG